MMIGESERYDDRREWKIWWQERVKDMMIGESERYDDRREWKIWRQERVKDMMIGESERYDDRREWKIWWQERVKDMMEEEEERKWSVELVRIELRMKDTNKYIQNILLIFSMYSRAISWHASNHIKNYNQWISFKF